MWFCLNSFITFSQINPDAILGKWITTTGNCMVEVYKFNTEYKAKVLWFKEGKKKMADYTDEKNPDANLRNRNFWEWM